MLRFVSILLVTFYSLIAIGLSVSISYCGNRIVDIQFFQDAEYCCKTPKKCCSKVNLSFELQEEVKPLDFFNLSFKVQSFDLFHFTPNYDLDFEKLFLTRWVGYKRFYELYPNLFTQYLYLKYCNLKICE